MTAKQNRKPSLDEVLTELAALPAPPDAAELRHWLDRYPEFKADIIDFVTDWVEMAEAHVADEPSREEIDLVVNRTMSRLQQMFDEAKRPPSVKDLLTDIQAAGHDLESFQRAVGIDRAMMTCLAERMIRPATIPLQLVTAMAEALGRAVDTVRAYLLLPPQPAAAYKARKRPAPTQVDFASIVAHSDLPEPQKARWLAEPPDPKLGG